MKEKVILFFKRNWIIFALVGLAILLLFLGFLTTYCIVAGCLILSGTSFYLFARFKAKYNESKKVDANKDIFDARKLDYDEDVYYVGDGQKKAQLKLGWSQFSALMPTIFFAILGIMCCSFAIALIFRAFI